MRPNLTGPLDALTAIGLADLEATAAVDERIDRKYVVTVELLATLLAHLAKTHGVLEMSGTRAFEYRTTYYDTPGLLTYRDHVQRRRRRFKARARQYVDSGSCAFEVKVKGRRGCTVKHRMSYDRASAEALTQQAWAFLLECLHASYAGPVDEPLEPSLTVCYRRVSLVAPELVERVTCDLGVAYASPHGALGRMADGVAIVETKSSHGATVADRVLRELGARPEPYCSKYCIGIGLTRPELRSNAFRHLQRRHFTALPAALAAALAVALPGAAPETARAAARVATPLPLVSIDTSRPIRDEPKVAGRMRIVNRPGNRLNRPRHRPNAYRGRIGVEYRGQLSQTWSKRSLAIETRTRRGKDRDVRLLGLPRDADWVLDASHADRSLLRNTLAYEAARRLGAWAPRTRHVEVLLRGRYHGVHVLTEPLELNARRIRAPKKTVLLELTHHEKLDRGDETVVGPVTGSLLRFADAGDKVSGKERDRAETALANFEHALYGAAAADPASGWRRWLDERSAVDFVLVQELFRNQDAFWSSTHLRLHPDGRFRLGPVWDFDLSAGNTLESFRSSPEGWGLAERAWAQQLLNDAGFVRALAARWREVRQRGIVEALQRSAQRQGATLAGPAARNFRRWPVLAEPLFPAQPVRGSYPEEVAALQDWLGRRGAWLDQALAGA